LESIELAGKRKTQTERRTESEQALLTAAAELLVEQGYNAATFEKISQRAGYSASLVTSRFGSRDGLFIAIIDFLRIRLEAFVDLHTKSGDSGKGQLKSFSNAFLIQLDHDPLAKAYYVLLAAAVANQLPQQRYFFEQHERIKQRLSEIILAGRQDGSVIEQVDTHQMATAIGCFHLGIAMQLQLDQTMSAFEIGLGLQLLEDAL
jgi:AcrR family transcriptional regulator